jgi:serine/threonine protein kinase
MVARESLDLHSTVPYTSSLPRIMALTPTSGPNESALAYESEGGGDPKKVWHRLARWFAREDETPPPREHATPNGETTKPGLSRRISRRVVPGLPRPGTFKRQNSERRDRLEPVSTATEEKRALSVDRRKLWKDRPRSVPPQSLPRLSAPAVYSCEAEDKGDGETEDNEDATAIESAVAPARPIEDSDLARAASLGSPMSQEPEPPPPETHSFDLAPLPMPQSPPLDTQRPLPPLSPPPEAEPPPDSELDEEELRVEHDERWILNLSMHFRDRSPREKFFITYAETPSSWRRITVSVDYRNAPTDSLERDLQALPYQRDKSFRIYEAIRPSLPDIQWYDTVTNLRLETSADDRLHVHVTEDENEIISYPSVRLLDHIDIPRISEKDVEFQSHMSGFVYKVRVQNKVLIKKEIPGPDSVEEFLYEINALYSLIGAPNVVQFEGLVVDDEEGLVKGVLIAYAEQGPLVDIIYDYRGHLDWERRQKWARQIVNGLSQIHESGFVQGDFTLSNIVIDENDAAVIIDINRRGCPVGWEPPEIARMIQSGQRISMYIGVKSDLFQLGMVLWGLAAEEDEPERQDRPLSLESVPVPQYFKDVVATCLEDEPRKREAAKTLLAQFPEVDQVEPSTSSSHKLEQPQRLSSSILDAPFGDHSTGVGYPDRSARSRSARSLSRSRSRFSSRSRGFSDSHTYFDGRSYSIDTPLDGPSSYIVPHRGRSPPNNTSHLRSKSYERPRPLSDAAEVDLEPQILAISPSHENKWEEILDPEGNSFLVETDENPEERQCRIQRSKERMQQQQQPPQSLSEAIKQVLPHVDSGLADMDGINRTPTDLTFRHAPTSLSLDRSSTGFSTASTPFGGLNLNSTTSTGTFHHTDSGLADMDLAGVGENELLKNHSDKDLELDLGAFPEPGADLVTVAEDEVVQNFDSGTPQRAEHAAPALGYHSADEKPAETSVSDTDDGNDLRQSIATSVQENARDAIG